MKNWRSLIAFALVCLGATAQETRSIIFGTIHDPQAASVAGASVVVANKETGTVTRLTTNSGGYYEANLLLPGEYDVTVEASGFKKLIRRSVTLPVSSRIEVSLTLEIGAVSDTVSVTADAPLLETNSVSSGRVLDTRSLMDLPVQGNSALLLVKQTTGIQFGGVNNELGLHSNAGGSDYNVNGNVGGNSWSMDGTPLNANGRRTGYVPLSDTVAEFKVETGNFDAAIAQTTGATISMISKSGTNSLHGTGSWQHWQRRWNGSPFFVKQLYYRNIAAAEAAGNTARANDLRNQDKQPSGRSNLWTATVGGPVHIPKVFDGRNKLFFFYSYAKRQDIKTEDANSINRTIPTMLQREGNFTELLRADAVRYQLYDPLTVRVNPARPGTWIRDPIPGNIIPRSRMLNPMYEHYLKLLPTPNNPGANAENRNNYIAVGTPYNWDYKVHQNRIDYNVNDKHRTFFRWSHNNFMEDRADWTYESARGLHSNGLNRTNIGATADWVWTMNANTIFDFAASVNQFREGDRITVPLQYSASQVGLPKYIDEFAGGNNILPLLDMNGYQDVSRGGVPAYTRFRVHSYKVDVTHIRGQHTIRGGVENRQYYRVGGGGGNTSGNFAFNNTFTRNTNDNNVNPAGDLNHDWAAFMLGFPGSMSIQRVDSFAYHNPSWGVYVQDNYRVNNKLSLNFGFRIEQESGPTERYNRAIGPWDPTISLPITAAAQAAYAANPLPEHPASQFRVQGSNTYLGSNGASRRAWPSEWMFMPRLAAAYTFNSKTVIRAGYGMFYDTLNVMNESLSQTNFTRTTNAIITTDAGVNWLIGDPRNGRPPITDPFPVRPGVGSRFDEPTRDALGSMAVAGRGFDHFGSHMQRARQQRWRLGFQRQLTESLMVDTAYVGSWSDRVNVDQPLNGLPEQYWNKTNVRNDAIATQLNAQVPNPFRLSNFESLRTSNPLVYQDMASNGFFTQATIGRNRLLRPYPHINGNLNMWRSPVGAAKTHSIELSVNKRFSKGFQFYAGYTWLWIREKDWFPNEFDSSPIWRLSQDGRPHRLVGTAIYELPFGRGRSWLKSGPAAWVAGGWQLGVTYEYQPGGLLDWGNNFYYGDTENIKKIDNKSLGQWFNTAGCVLPGRKLNPNDIEVAAGQPCTQGWEKRTGLTPAAYQARVFPNRMEGLRSDMTNQWNANLQKNVDLSEGIKLQLRLDALNLQNRSQFNGPDLNPVNSTFGQVTSQSAATNRFIQIQARIIF